MHSVTSNRVKGRISKKNTDTNHISRKDQASMYALLHILSTNELAIHPLTPSATVNAQ